ncbi:glycoside hydrolase family 16 protein [Cystobacter fuscus]|nr:glycoside hydrolase family 16 protein [Cystobacter fuscus]
MKRQLTTLATAVVVLLGFGPVSASAAVVNFSVISSDVTVTGNTAVATASISASAREQVEEYKVCVSPYSGGALDFSKRTNVYVNTAAQGGTSYTSASKTFANGTYQYAPCVLNDGVWYVLGGTPYKTFTVPQATPPPASVTFTENSLSATVNGTSVTVNGNIKASSSVTVQEVGIFATHTDGTVYDIAKQINVVVPTTGLALTGTMTVKPGTYTYALFVGYNNTWPDMPDKSFTVSGTTTPPTSRAPVGNLPGWTQNMVQDFDTAASTGTGTGSFMSTYANSWQPYDDAGIYWPRALINAHDGMMDINLDGDRGAAGVFGPPNRAWGHLYGRYSIRFKAVDAEGNGTAMMVWPASDYWPDGEIDFPEGPLDGYFNIYHHPTPCDDDDGDPVPHCGSSDSLTNIATFEDWHVATTEWTPTSVKYYVDGTLVKTVTHDIPTTNHRWTIQVAPDRSNAQSGHLLIDWVTSYTYTP